MKTGEFNGGDDVHKAPIEKDWVICLSVFVKICNRLRGAEIDKALHVLPRHAVTPGVDLLLYDSTPGFVHYSRTRIG